MTIENAKIIKVSLNMADHGCLTLDLILKGNGWGCVFGGYILGKGSLGSKKFEGSAKGMEAIMRIMDTIGVENLEDAKGKYVRVKLGDWGDSISCIGNIIEDKWFDYKEFFKEGIGEANED